MKKIFLLLLILLSVAFFYHQYRWADPYDAYLRREEIPADQILGKLKQWRYHTDVWFEIVPDALTTVFKRLGLGGWTETGHRACVEGCAYWTEYWTDGFHSVDLELQTISLDGKDPITFNEPRFFDVESWGKLRGALEKEGRVPQVGQRVRVCGPLRMDRPYGVFTLHPDRPEDYGILGACETLPKDPTQARTLAPKDGCQDFSKRSLFEQIAVIDGLADGKNGPGLDHLIENSLQCADPKVLQALSTNPDVYETLIARAPRVQSSLPPLTENGEGREGSPVKNTIADLLRHWFNVRKKS